MIPAQRNIFFSGLFFKYTRYRMRKAFNKLVVFPVTPKAGHSIILIGNHFSWWDGLWANYLAYEYLDRKLHIMINDYDLKKRKWLTWFGGFSINRTSRDMLKSLQYTTQLLNDPENLVSIFPQGKLESNHVTNINIEKGIEWLLKNTSAPCQVIYSCALIDYFESLKPSVYFHLFDCGTIADLTYVQLKEKINTFHDTALTTQINVKH